MRILGTNFFGHDSALCLLDTQRREVVAESTERCTRICNDWMDVGPTLRAIGIRDLDAACHGYHTLNSQDGEITTPLSLSNLELQKFERAALRPRYEADLGLSRFRKAASLAAALGRSPGAVLRYLRARASYAVRRERPVAAEEMLRYIGATLASEGTSCASVSLYDHHLCHAASAYFFSPFAFREKALVLSLDGAGDGHFSKLHLFDGPAWSLLGASRSPLLRSNGEATFLSIGAIYSSFTAALAQYGVENEGGLCALAAYGSPDDGLYRELRDCISVSAQGFVFDLSRATAFFDEAALAGHARRLGERNFAATVQRWLEDVVVEHLAAAHALHGTDNLCLAGGVAANIVMNLRIFERTPFRAIHVFPAMGDEGIAAGCAALRAVAAGEDLSWLADEVMPYYGHRVSDEEIRIALQRWPGLACEDLGTAWPERAATAIAQGKIVAVVHGRMEFGPRALGNRSILASPGSAQVRDRINRQIKRRPWFQPCCPSILEDERERLFEASLPHKHMAIAFRMREPYRALLPGAVHVDGTARAQFVEEADNPALYMLLRRLKAMTGFGVAINTSFNLHGRPIVRTADDALTDFLDCGLDELYLEGRRITRP